MNTPSHHDTLQLGMSLGSTHSQPSRPALSSSNTSKRVCFYKSGDPQFTGQWMVINNRTFKTFDALLDALSKKVSLPFGVRTITTPKGGHRIRNLGDLQNGGSYVCSDKKKIKPINLDNINRRQVHWNTTTLTSSRHLGRRGLIRQIVHKTQIGRTPNKAQNAIAVWTPKRLVVFRNRDPNTKRMIVLQRRTAPTFQALLEYLSQVMQFSVIKLYTPDGRRVEGLPALILCSGIVVAAGNEPFRPSNFKLQASFLTSQLTTPESVLQAKKQPHQKLEKMSTNGKPRSKQFSSFSKRYLVDQITESLNECLPKNNEHETGSLEITNNQPSESDEIESCDPLSGTEQNEFIMPTDDEIEKSFCVNQDGSMTVEMKVHLTVKQEEIIQWTTTVSRKCVNSQQMALCSQKVSSYNSPGSNINNSNQIAESKKDCESKYGQCDSSEPNPHFRRPTPGPRSVRRKETSVENIKRLTQSEVQESTVGTYSYMEYTAEGEVIEGYRVVSHSSSSSSTPLPKPRRDSSKTESSHKHGIAEVVQMQNNETGMTYSQPASSGAQNDLFSLSSQSSQSQKKHEKSYITDSETQDRSKSAGKGIKNPMLSTSENKIISGKKTEYRQKTKKLKKDAFVKPNVTEKRQNNSFKGSITDLRKNNSPDSHSNTESEKKTSLNGKTKSPNESKELSESISLPVIHLNSSDVHQYVKNWLENIQPESVPYMHEIDLHKNDCEPKAKFQISSDFSDTSEKNNKSEIYNMMGKYSSDDMSTKRPVSCPPVMLEEETMETQNIKGFCKSTQYVKIQPATHETCMRIQNSSEASVSKEQDLNGETLENTNVTTKSDMKQVLEQLCLSIQTLRRVTSDSCLTSLENKKRSSLPDFSTHLFSSIFRPSKSLFSLLTVKKLKDGISNVGIEGQGSYSEALHLMQSIEKIASIEDKEELKDSLTSLHSSPSAHLKSYWKDSTEKNDTDEHTPLSPKQSFARFALEVNSDDDDQYKKQNDVNDVLDMGVDLHREIISFEGRYLTNVNKAETSIECKNEYIIIKEDLTLDKGHSYSEKMENQDCGIQNTANSEFHQLESSIQKNFVVVEDRTVITCMLGNVQTNQEGKETSQPNLYEEKQNLENNDEHQPLDYSQTDIDAKNLEPDNAASEQSENEPQLYSSTSFKSNSESTQQEQNTDSLGKCYSNAGEEGICQLSTSEVKHDTFYNNENYNVEQLNNFIFKKEENGHDTAMSEASNCSVDNGVPYNNDNGLKDDNTIQDVDELSKDFKTQEQKAFKGDHSSSSSFSSNCVNIETPKAQPDDLMGMEEGATNFISQCEHLMEIPQQLLDFVNLALKTSALTFECDLNGQPRIHPDRCKITKMPFSEHSVVQKCTQKCLPSPNTSELSDYRSETTDSRANLSQVSSDLLTESGNDEADKQGNINEITINRGFNNGLMKSNSLSDSNQIASPSLKSIKSLTSSNSTMQQQAHCNTSDLINGNPKTIKCLPVNAELDSGDGILIDKGRWLLKENHLIRKSPPVPPEMYEDADTTSADTGQDNADEDYTFGHRMIQHPTLDVMSSSELEDMAKPVTPNCTYFNMVHSSESDPFQDNQSINSNKRQCGIRKSKEPKVSPMSETSKMSTKQTGSLHSFASVEFKLAAGKVHPEGDQPSGAAKSVSCLNENEPTDGLNLTCGQHCPIL